MADGPKGFQDIFAHVEAQIAKRQEDLTSLKTTLEQAANQLTNAQQKLAEAQSGYSTQNQALADAKAKLAEAQASADKQKKMMEGVEEEHYAASIARDRAKAVQGLADRFNGVIGVATNFEFAWDCTNTGAKSQGNFHRTIAPAGYLPLGVLPMVGYNWATGKQVAVIKRDGPIPWDYPKSYRCFWSTERTNARHQGSFWQPEAPPGFVALGCVIQNSLETPPREAIACIHSSFIDWTSAKATVKTWSNDGVGRGPPPGPNPFPEKKISFWLHDKLGIAIPQRGYNAPKIIPTISLDAVKAALGTPRSADQPSGEKQPAFYIWRNDLEGGGPDALYRTGYHDKYLNYIRWDGLKCTLYAWGLYDLRVLDVQGQRSIVRFDGQRLLVSRDEGVSFQEEPSARFRGWGDQDMRFCFEPHVLPPDYAYRPPDFLSVMHPEDSPTSGPWAPDRRNPPVSIPRDPTQPRPGIGIGIVIGELLNKPGRSVGTNPVGGLDAISLSSEASIHSMDIGPSTASMSIPSAGVIEGFGQPPGGSSTASITPAIAALSEEDQQAVMSSSKLQERAKKLAQKIGPLK